MKTNPEIQAIHEQQVREQAKQRLQSAIKTPATSNG
jgi:hypothetical protein